MAFSSSAAVRMWRFRLIFVCLVVALFAVGAKAECNLRQQSLPSLSRSGVGRGIDDPTPTYLQVKVKEGQPDVERGGAGAEDHKMSNVVSYANILA